MAKTNAEDQARGRTLGDEPHGQSSRSSEIAEPDRCARASIFGSARAATGRFPPRAEMSPRDMADMLRNTVLVRVLDGGEEFEFRIVGDAMVVAQGCSFRA